MISGHNQRRVFSEVISLDAWHEPFKIDQETYGVFAEVSFSEGRIGGDDPEIPFTFNVSLKKALLTIKLEQPLRIDKKTVARGIPSKQAEYTQVVRAKDEARRHVGISGKITPALIGAALQGDVSKSSEVSKETEIRVMQEIPEILVTARPEGNHAYSWELEPLLNERLKGQPWNPVEQARMRVILPDKFGVSPAIRVEIRCALEDLSISGLKPKRPDFVEKYLNVPRPDINEAAAIQHLKKLLTMVELYPGAMDNRFNTVILADVIATES